MSYGYAGKILAMDLTSQKIQKTSTENYFDAELFVGGKGLGALILWRELKPHIDPLSPENVLVFSTGPLTGTLCPSARMCIVAKSPSTNTFCDSHIGGHLGSEIKFAGYDAIIVRGKSERPVYLWVNNEEVEICDAKHLWGLDTFHTEEKIRNERNDPTIRIACIGPAGEHLVKFALVNTERYRQAGRGGIGAVMGSKNLKALAVQGSGQIRIHNLESFIRVAKEAREAILENKTIRARRRWGTARSVLFSSDRDLFPTRNFREATFEAAENLSAEVFEKRFWVKHKACHGCPVNCGKLGVVRSGTYAGTVVEGAEYETASLVGANCGISNHEAIVYANMLCDKLGLDTISTGNVIAFAMECYEKGMLTTKDTDGLQLNFGNEEALIKMIQKIATREDVGNLLADGVKQYSEKVGEKTGAFAMHVKGLELPGWGVRAAPGMGLAYATADRGGCHMRAWTTRHEISGVVEIVKSQQDYYAACDCLVACQFVKDVVGKERYVQMLNAATGMQMTTDDFVKVGERIWNLTRLFNVREGFGRKDDTLPKRMLTEPLPSGIAKGQRLTQAQLDQMLDEYYELRRWSIQTGTPSKEKLRELELNPVNS
ncbi:MAG: aldehyde ferredoxin oxidoreductase family protein [Candidatus Bathyarchaeota archaeon]|nr:aldehyde ferredoxin oxidoreductase family protein [Candidatus Bathyarchaeota archaeon]